MSRRDESIDPPDTSGDKSENLTEYVCRYGSMHLLGVMSCSRGRYRYGDEVVIRSDRGTELATVLCEATSAAIDHMEEPTQGRILRKLNDTDRGDWQQMADSTRRDLEACLVHVTALSLPMQLVDVERLLGGERVIVYFIADGRVDFRELVKRIGREFQTRIEMRQIGIRHSAKLLADYGDCGQEVCCSRFLSKMPPVSMKMAKLQRASLDPTKISGRCGRLKCCLRYEYDHYSQTAEELPNVGSKILTRDGNATVLAQDLISQQLVLRTEDGRRVMLPGAEVVQVLEAGPENGGPESKRKNSRGEKHQKSKNKRGRQS